MSKEFRNLLIEIGTEELPPKALLKLALAFRDAVKTALDSNRISSGTIKHFASPRRLALVIEAVGMRQRDTEAVRRGPSVTAAFLPDGTPSKAALGFARSCGTSIDALEREITKKGEWLCHREKISGDLTASLIPQLVELALGQLPIPKRMRWGSGNEEFVRPVHWVCIVFGNEVVPGRVLGIQISDETRGHRFHHPEGISISDPAVYADVLRRVGRVEPSFERRRDSIEEKAIAACASEGLFAQIDEQLLDEVTGLVEWPNAILGQFDEGFLEVPSEVLIETMQKHQKYFPVRDSKGDLVARFVAVPNIESREPIAVRLGNERVIRPRFADAKFFWEQDIKQPLVEYFYRLESIVYQKRLGSIADKSRRVERLARAFAEFLGLDIETAGRAAILSKCDLASAMVGEFPGLQGIMGRYYAERSGESPAVSRALDEQYLPRFSGDGIPGDGCSQLLAVADRIDTLVGIFGVGLKPSGTKDPYGLRRASIAVMRIMIEAELPLDLRDAIALAEGGFPDGVIGPGSGAAVFDYMIDRLCAYYEEKGISADVVDSVQSIGESVPLIIDQRIAAVSAFRKLPEAKSLAAANKRIRNILTKSDVSGIADSPHLDKHVDVALFSEAGEQALWEVMSSLESDISSLLKVKAFSTILERLATLRDPVDAYFDQVMVNVGDSSIRKNRLAMLERLMAMFLNVADISRLH